MGIPHTSRFPEWIGTNIIQSQKLECVGIAIDRRPLAVPSGQRSGSQRHETATVRIRERTRTECARPSTASRRRSVRRCSGRATMPPHPRGSRTAVEPIGTPSARPPSRVGRPRGGDPIVPQHRRCHATLQSGDRRRHQASSKRDETEEPTPSDGRVSVAGPPYRFDRRPRRTRVRENGVVRRAVTAASVAETRAVAPSSCPRSRWPSRGRSTARTRRSTGPD